MDRFPLFDDVQVSRDVQLFDWRRLTGRVDVAGTPRHLFFVQLLSAFQEDFGALPWEDLRSVDDPANVGWVVVQRGEQVGAATLIETSLAESSNSIVITGRLVAITEPASLEAAVATAVANLEMSSSEPSSPIRTIRSVVRQTTLVNTELKRLDR